MNPVVLRALILVTELLVFFIMTAFTSYFISHATAWQHGEGEAPPAQFPVIAYDGDRSRPNPRNYFVVRLGEWKGVAEKRPQATPLLPERIARMKIGDAGEASFTVTDEPASGQAPSTGSGQVPSSGPGQIVELNWRAGGGDYVARYVARETGIEPRYLRMLGTNTFLGGAVIGFLAGVMVGRGLRRRFLARPA
ncbi:MAG TPA: hypothetical protein VLC73_17030 [Burkholderiales bacterium]|nr:hypothetical protein [Burkholderiales bacterium]